MSIFLYIYCFTYFFFLVISIHKYKTIFQRHVLIFLYRSVWAVVYGSSVQWGRGLGSRESMDVLKIHPNNFNGLDELSAFVEAQYWPFKMLAYKRESKKVSMNGRLKIQKRKKNSKRLLLNLLINFTKMDDQKIRINFPFQIMFRCLWAHAICVDVKLGLRKWNLS